MRPMDADALAKHVRIHCGDCGEAVECIMEAPTITPPPNDPLTLEELREMDGESVWNDTMKKWALVDLTWEFGERTVDAGGKWRDFNDRYYRRKPEALDGEAAPALSRPEDGQREGTI